MAGEEGVQVCVEIGGTQFEACVGPRLLGIALQNGFCGECPTESPTAATPSTLPEFPTPSPSLMPSAAPSSLGDICTPANLCEGHVNAAYIGVDFCFLFPETGSEFSVCLPTRFVEGAIRLGK